MADITNLSEFLTDIADAIRTKNSTTEPIAAENFDTEILNLKTGGGDVKLFETEEEMQADETAVDGDLAVVYRSEVQNMTSTSQAQVINFPAIVVLPTAFTSSTYCMFRGETGMSDVQVELSQTRCRIRAYTMGGSVTVNYTSTDGITYTRTTAKDTVDFGEPISCYHEEEWVDEIGYFMQSGGMTFEGLYNRQLTDDIWRNYFFYNVKCPSGSTAPEVEWTDLIETKDVLDLINEKYSYYNGEGYLQYVDDNNFIAYLGKYTAYGSTHPIKEGDVVIANNKIYLGFYNRSGYVFEMIKVTINMETKQTTEQQVTALSTVAGAENYLLYVELPLDTKLLSYDGYHGVAEDLFSVYTASSFNDSIYKEKEQIHKYLLAPTQLTLKSANELLPGKIAYGKNGVITGENSVYDNLDYPLILQSIGINVDELETINSVSSSNAVNKLITYTENTDFDSVQHDILNVIDATAMDTACNNAAGYEFKCTHAIELNNGNKITCIVHKVNNTGSNRRLTMIMFDKSFNVLSTRILVTNENIMGNIQYLFDDDCIYIIVGGYYNSNNYWYVTKINREDGSVIKQASSVNAKANYGYTKVALYNGGVLIYGEDSGYTKYCTLTHFTSDLVVDVNTSIDLNGSMGGSSGVSIGVIVDGSFYCVGCGYISSTNITRKLIRLNGTNVTTKDITSLTSSFNVITDGTYIYGFDYTKKYCIQFDTNMNVINSTKPISDRYANNNHIIISMDDYLNYTALNYNTNALQVVINGTNTTYEPKIELESVSCYNVKPENIVWRRGVNTNKLYKTGGYLLTKQTSLPTNKEPILITTDIDTSTYAIYYRLSENTSGPISQDEYNTAVETANEILGEEV